MGFRGRLLASMAVTLAGTSVLLVWAVSWKLRRTFEELAARRSAAVVEQFRHELAQRGAEVAQRVTSMTDTEATLRMAMDLVRPEVDLSLYQSDARGLSRMHALPFVEIVNHDGTVVSSAHWPARIGGKNDWVTQGVDWRAAGAFLRREELPGSDPAGANTAALALTVVRPVQVGEKKVYVIGGQRVDHEFLSTLALPAGMRALLYFNLQPDFSPRAISDKDGPLLESPLIVPLVKQILEDMHRRKVEIQEAVSTTPDPAAAETFQAVPLTGREHELLGMLLVGSSRREMVELVRFTEAMGAALAGVGILMAVFVSWWAAARVTLPARRLASAVRQLSGGDTGTGAGLRPRDEVVKLAAAFDQMSAQLGSEQKSRLEGERIAAWQGFARNLAATLPQTADLESLKVQLVEFAELPAPQLAEVQLNDLVRAALHGLDAELGGVGRPTITPELYLQEDLPVVRADSTQVNQVVRSVLRRAIAAMPGGGTLTVRTRACENGVQLDVADTGAGLSPEQAAHLFDPFASPTRPESGLALAYAYLVVHQHGGQLNLESEAGAGTTILVQLPIGGPIASSPAGTTC